MTDRMTNVLIVDDRGEFLATDYNYKFKSDGYCFEVEREFDTKKIIKMLERRKSEIPIILLDIRDITGKPVGIEVLRRIKAKFGEEIQVIMLTVDESLDMALEAGKNGACGYIIKGKTDKDYLLEKLDGAYKLAKGQRDYAQVKAEGKIQFGEFIGGSDKIRVIHDLIKQVAVTDISILLLGETGTGKTLLAREIHKQSLRYKEAFMDENIAAIPKYGNLMEEALFGRVIDYPHKGDSARKGIFEEANGGTVFLDEIGDTTPAVQIALLKALETKSVKKLGATKPTETKFRLISGTSQDLKVGIDAKTFREDLYYRISGIEIELPSLRDRREDIPLLIWHLLEKTNEKYKRSFQPPNGEDINLLCSYKWPGNVRELERVIERCVVLTSESEGRLGIPDYVKRQLATSDEEA